MSDAVTTGNDGDNWCTLSKNWWLFVLRGLLALVLAVLAFLMPTEALFALTLVYGAFSLVDGAFSLVAAVRKIRRGRRWGWLAFRGVVGVIAGIFVLVVPFVATWVLAVFLWSSIAVWSALVGALELATAWRLRKEIRGEIWLMASGLLSVVLSGVVVWLLWTRPIESFISLGWLLGGFAAFLGVFLIMLGIRLRRHEVACSRAESAGLSGANG